jgi:hypothetical protein
MAGRGWWSSDLSSTNRSWGPRKCSEAVLTLGFATSFKRFPYLYNIKYVPLRQRAGTQKVKRRKLLVQHVIDKNTCESCQSLSPDT